MKKIAYCIDSLSLCGGREMIVVMKANYLAEHGYEVHIICYQDREKPSFFKLSPKVKTHWVDVDMDYTVTGHFFLSRFLQRRRIRGENRQRYYELLSQIKPDITISTFCDEFRFLHKVNDGSKKVLEIHFSKYHLWYKSKDFGWKGRMRSLYQVFRNQMTARHYDAFVCLTHEDAASWKPMRNLHVIENPITIPDMGEADTDLKRAIAVGRLATQKRHDILIRCWAQVAADIRKGWKLDIYGDGSVKEELNQQIIELGIQDSVCIHAPVKNIAEEYLKSSIYCSTARHEGFSLAMCEAMSAGLPVVTFKHPCGASDMIQDESMGMLIPMGREDLFVEKLQQLMTNPELRRKMGAAARRSIYERYTVEVIMQKWVALFRELGVT